jgi:hypothetical protein
MIPNPIFIVGSPRSGTSVFTWCLGQHSAILALEESNWLGPLTIDLAANFRTGGSRKEHSMLGMLGLSEDNFLSSIGGTIDCTILNSKEKIVEKSHQIALANPELVSADIRLIRSEPVLKTRWVDGTPEYSFYIFELLKLFPRAKFIHLLREPDAVAKSLLKFRGDCDSAALVSNSEEAYDYWLRTVRYCVEAEQALGPQLIARLNYDDLIRDPENSLRSVLGFLGESYEDVCLAPLNRRINSSYCDVGNAGHMAEVTDASNRAEACELSEKQRAAGMRFDDANAAGLLSEMRARYDGRVKERIGLWSQLNGARKLLDERQAELDQRAKWNLSLDEELRKCREELKRRDAELAERTAWAISLDKELKLCREAYEKRSLEFEERSAWSSTLKEEPE